MTSEIVIKTDDYTWTGWHTVAIQIYEEYSQTTKDSTFQLLVECVQSLTPTSQINDIVYYVGDPDIEIMTPGYEVNPIGCPFDYTFRAYRINYELEEIPFIIQYDDINRYFVQTNNPALVGVYQISIFATDTLTLVPSSESIFKVTIRLRVTGLNIVTGTNVSDLTYRVGSPAVVLTAPEYTLEPANANLDSLHELGPLTPAFVTLLGATTDQAKIQIATSDPSHTGIYEIDIHFTDRFSGLKMTDTFVLTVSCIG